MVSKRYSEAFPAIGRFRAVLFRMVSKLSLADGLLKKSFRAVLFRMVSKPFS